METEHRENEVIITNQDITLRFGDMEPIVIPRRTLRTRLQLIEGIHRLTSWPGMNLRRMQIFIETVFRHHGWALADQGEDPLPAPPRKAAVHRTMLSIDSKSRLMQPPVAA